MVVKREGCSSLYWEETQEATPQRTRRGEPYYGKGATLSMTVVNPPYRAKRGAHRIVGRTTPFPMRAVPLLFYGGVNHLKTKGSHRETKARRKNPVEDIRGGSASRIETNNRETFKPNQ
jgi:hypothetical protein